MYKGVKWVTKEGKQQTRRWKPLQLRVPKCRAEQQKQSSVKLSAVGKGSRGGALPATRSISPWSSASFAGRGLKVGQREDQQWHGN